MTAQDRDALTGLPGPEYAHAALKKWEENARIAGEIAPIHALMLGLRRFETVNLAYGEEAGDSALLEVATRMNHFAQEEIEGEWFAARVGGGNFLLAAIAPCSRERWQWLAETLADLVARPIPNRYGEGTIRLWPRIALLRTLPGEASAAIFDRMAETLARAQRQSGERVAWADGDIALAGRGATQLDADLLAALDRDEIEILYQPQFALSGDRLVGAEALARWHHPQLGRIGGGALFAIAERAEHVTQLSRHVVARALQGANAWPERLRLSLNVTPADLAASSFANEMAALIVDQGFSPDRLTLEITEQALLGDLDQSARTLSRLRDLGIRLALDDFGAGFCNFRYLKLLPLHYLKLDRSMVDDIENDPRDLAVFRAILAMAKALDLKVICEGVENEEQRELIAREGCEFYQGFLRAEPLGASEFSKLAEG